MNKVFCLYNWDDEEIVAISHDEGLLQEMLCDSFFDDLYQQFCWDTCGPFSYNLDRTLPEIYNDIWDYLIDWYSNYMDIMEITDKVYY